MVIYFYVYLSIIQLLIIQSPKDFKFRRFDWSYDSCCCFLSEVTHRFSHCCGKNVQITSNGSTACRSQNFNHGLIFSSDPLKRDEIFEIKIEKLSKQWSGSLRIGLTSMAISDTTPASSVPLSSLDLTSKLTWVVTGSEVKKSGVTIKENYCPSLERLEVRPKIKNCVFQVT